MVKADEQQNGTPESDAPRGTSAVEIGARRGFGPLSALAREVWHGDSRPCASCGQLVRREASTCDACGEDLSEGMLSKMRAHAGPWFVLEHIRPFPGVTCERLVRQIRRGVLTRFTIVQGPMTDHQWRYAGDTPGLCKYLGICWNCYKPANLEKVKCPACGVDLGELNDLPAAPAGSGSAAAAGSGSGSVSTRGAESAELRRLAALTRTVPRSRELQQDVSRVGVVKVSWIIAAIVLVVMVVLFAVVKVRERESRHSEGFQSPQVTTIDALAMGRL